MTVTTGLLVTLEAKPGREQDVAAFLASARDIVEREPATVTWYAVRQGPTTFGIFDTFESAEGREAHLTGGVADALGQVADDLLAAPPEIRPLEVLAAKP